MNREQKAVAIAEIAASIEQAHAIFAVDYRGISVPEAAELRSKLREADATFKVVKNSLTERAADQAGVQTLKPLLTGPTALTFVRGDVAVAAKAIADYARATQLLPFKGGLMDGAEVDSEQIRAISRLPSREALYGQLVGVVASPVSGLVRSLGALVGGLAVALGQVREKKESGELPAGEPPAAAAPAEEPAAQEPATEEPAAEGPAAEQAPAEPAPEPQTGDEPAAAAEANEEPVAEAEANERPPAADEPAAEDSSPAEAQPPDQGEAEAAAEPEAKIEEQAEQAPETERPAAGETPAGEQPAEAAQSEAAVQDDNQADVSAEAESQDAETNPSEED